MANLRTGQYGGQYYGSCFNESVTLSNSEMELNALYLYQILHYIHGWSLNAVAGMLGNIQAESAMNPGRWEGDNVGTYSRGYGLVQWTPATKYTEWCTANGWSDPSEMDAAIARIIHELENGGQYYTTDTYDLSFREFSVSELSPEYLAKAFLLNYERPEDQSESVQNYRASLARHWYNYLYSEPTPDPEPDPDPDPPTPTPSNKKKRRKFKFVLYVNRKKGVQ